MGCNSYGIQAWNGGGWAEACVSLNYDDEHWPCLCTRRDDSHNTEAFSAEDVRSMAALGAALVLAHNGSLGQSYITTPAELPAKVKAAIEYFIPTTPVSDREDTEAGVWSHDFDDGRALLADFGHDAEIGAMFEEYDRLVRWEEHDSRLAATDPVQERAAARGRIVAFIADTARRPAIGPTEIGGGA